MELLCYRCEMILIYNIKLFVYNAHDVMNETFFSRLWRHGLQSQKKIKKIQKWIKTEMRWKSTSEHWNLSMSTLTYPPSKRCQNNNSGSIVWLWCAKKLPVRWVWREITQQQQAIQNATPRRTNYQARLYVCKQKDKY